MPPDVSCGRRFHFRPGSIPDKRILAYLPKFRRDSTEGDRATQSFLEGQKTTFFVKTAQQRQQGSL